jgi:C4-dicarboxylate-binding protein DctP
MKCVARIAAGLAAFAFVLAAQAAEPVKLRLTLQLPITSHLGVNLAQFKEEVEKRSNGSLAIEIFPDAKLYKDNQVIDAISSGKIEMGSASLTQFSSIVPASKIFYQPFLFNYEPLVRAATRPGSEIRTVIDNAIAKTTGMHVLWWQSYGNTVFFSRGRPVDDLSGLQGMKVRVSGDVMHDFVNACGGVASVISASQQNQALQDGTVDAAMTGVTGVTSRELWKVTDTITRTDHAALEFIVLINGKVWDGLSQEHKTIINEVGQRVEKALRLNMADIEERSYEFARAKNMTIVAPTQNQLAEWRACSAKIFEDFMQNNSEVAPRMMAAYAKLRTDPCCNHQPVGAFNRH